jgi:hypothetical protein
MRERHQLFFGLRLACKKFHHSATWTKIELHFGGFFQCASQLEDRILCKPWTEQAGGWIPFCMKRLRTLNSYQIFKIKNRKLKTYSGWCPFKELSNDTTLMQIQSGPTVPLKIQKTTPWRLIRPEPSTHVTYSSIHLVTQSVMVSQVKCKFTKGRKGTWGVQPVWRLMFRWLSARWCRAVSWGQG